MTKFAAAFATIVLALAVQGTAFAGNSDGAAHAPAAWASMDANSDGVLTRDEVATTPWADKFKQMDANGDGKVTKKEFAQYEKRMKHRQHQSKDGGS